MEGIVSKKWNHKMFQHLRRCFGVGAAAHTQAHLKLVLLCLTRAFPKQALPHDFTSRFVEYVMLEEVNAAFWVLAQTNTINDEASQEDSGEDGHDEVGGHLAYNSCVAGEESSSNPEVVVQEIQHAEEAARIHPVEAAEVIAEMEAGCVERLAASPSSGDGPGEGHRDLVEDSRDTRVSDPEMDTTVSFSPYSHLVLLNFTRHPRSFEAGLMNDENLREARETLQRAGLELRLASGAFVFVSPDEYPTLLLAVEGRALTASHVIVSEMLEPVVRAAVTSATSHRDNVRLREKQDLGYAGEQPVIPERTFLSVPRALRNPKSVTNSTTAAHASTNPRRFTSGP